MANFTLRLSDDEDKKLSEIKTQLGLKSSNATIIFMINNFLQNKREIDKKKEQIASLTKEKDDISRNVKNALGAIDNLKNLIKC